MSRLILCNLQVSQRMGLCSFLLSRLLVPLREKVKETAQEKHGLWSPTDFISSPGSAKVLALQFIISDFDKLLHLAHR